MTNPMPPDPYRGYAQPGPYAGPPQPQGNPYPPMPGYPRPNRSGGTGAARTSGILLLLAAIATVVWRLWIGASFYSVDVPLALIIVAAVVASIMMLIGTRSAALRAFAAASAGMVLDKAATQASYAWDRYDYTNKGATSLIVLAAVLALAAAVTAIIAAGSAVGAREPQAQFPAWQPPPAPGLYQPAPGQYQPPPVPGQYLPQPMPGQYQPAPGQYQGQPAPGQYENHPAPNQPAPGQYENPASGHPANQPAPGQHENQPAPGQQQNPWPPQ